MKPYKFRTDRDLIPIKKENCIHCAYSSMTTSTTNHSEVTCSYILITEHRRPCMPEECRENGVFKPKKRRRR